MPAVEAVITVPVPPAVAFAVSQTVAPIRYRWDPFVREQHFVDGATGPGKGVQTFTRSRHGFTMISEYVSYAPPTNVGMKMVRGPWFFETFAGGWRFAPGSSPDETIATWRYHFRIRPRLLRPAGELIGRWLLGRDIRKRIRGYAAGCSDPVVLEAAVRAVAPGFVTPSSQDG
jgi:polyketide cyclase/dehydrase/lipid transport protein